MNFNLTNYRNSLLTLLALDAAWIYGIAKPYYLSKIGPMMGPVRWWAVAAFYLVYSGAISGLTLDSDIKKAAYKGALLGAASYGAYNFTNAAILKDWPIEMTWPDLFWGTAMTAGTAALVSYLNS